MSKIIDGKKVVYTFIIKARVGDYTVHQDKIWNITGSGGPAYKKYKILERKNERISLLNTELPKVISPTGYINI
jgi:hypothetical protein